MLPGTPDEPSRRFVLATWWRLAFAFGLLPTAAALMLLGPCEHIGLELAGSGNYYAVDVGLAGLALTASIGGGILVLRRASRALQGGCGPSCRRHARAQQLVAILHLATVFASLGFAAYIVHGIGKLG